MTWSFQAVAALPELLTRILFFLPDSSVMELYRSKTALAWCCEACRAIARAAVSMSSMTWMFVFLAE